MPTIKPPNLDREPDAEKRVKLDDITARGLQQRKATDPATVERYAEIYRTQGANALPAIHLVRDRQENLGARTLWLGDGQHRMAGARKAGLESLPAKIWDGDKRDVLLIAARGNAAHGLPLTREDKHLMVAALFADPEWALWSDRTISTQLHISADLIAKVRKSIPEAQSNVRKGADGRVQAKRGTSAKAQAAAAKPKPKIDPAVHTLARLIFMSKDFGHLHIVKRLILAVLFLARTKPLTRDELQAAVVERLDVHAGQLSKGEWVSGSAQQDYQLTSTGRVLIQALINADQHHSVMPPSAPAAAEKSASPATGKHDYEKKNLVTRKDGTDLWACKHCGKEYVRRGFAWSAPELGCPKIPAVAVEPETLGPASVEEIGRAIDQRIEELTRPGKPATAAAKGMPLVDRQLDWMRQTLAEDLTKHHGWKGNPAEACLLVLMVGMNALVAPPAWDDQALAAAVPQFADALREEVATAMRTGNSWKLPDLATLCRLWGIDHDGLRIRAERAIRE